MKSLTRTVITLETWQRTTVRIARETVSPDEPAVHKSSRDPRQSVTRADDRIPIFLEPGGQEKYE